MSTYARIEIKSDFEFLIDEMNVSEPIIEKIKSFFRKDTITVSVIECQNTMKDSKDYYFVIYVKDLNSICKVNLLPFIVCKGIKVIDGSITKYKAYNILDISEAESVSDIIGFVNENYNHIFHIYTGGRIRQFGFFDKLGDLNKKQSCTPPSSPFGNITPQQMMATPEADKAFIKIFEDSWRISKQDCSLQEKMKMVIDVFNVNTGHKYRDSIIGYEDKIIDFYQILESLKTDMKNKDNYDEKDFKLLLMATLGPFMN